MIIGIQGEGLPIDRALLGNYHPTSEIEVCDLLLFDVGSVARPLAWLREFQSERQRPVVAWQAEPDWPLAVKLLSGGPHALARDYLYGAISPVALLRLIQSLTEEVRVGELRLNLVAKVLTYYCREVELSPRLIDVTAVLMEANGRYVPYPELAERILGERMDLRSATSKLDSAVSRLRDGLEKSGLFVKNPLQSAHGRGHRIHDPGPTWDVTAEDGMT